MPFILVWLMAVTIFTDYDEGKVFKSVPFTHPPVYTQHDWAQIQIYSREVFQFLVLLK